MNMYPSFLASEITVPAPEDALFHIIPVPCEKTVSYGAGTAQGPAAILQASQQLELFDGTCIPAEQGIYTHPPLDCSGDIEHILSTISDTVSGVLTLGKIPVLLGGEHSITFGAAYVARDHFPAGFGVVHFDAHADLRDTFEGSRFSHACVMHRVLEISLPLFQIGIRALSLAQHRLRLEKKIGTLDAHVIAAQGMPATILPDDFPENIYLSIDVDAFDPSIMPATGTPEPGGLTWYQMMQALTSVLQGRRLIGMDLVELAPMPGFHAPDFTAAKLIYSIFGIIARNNAR